MKRHVVVSWVARAALCAVVVALPRIARSPYYMYLADLAGISTVAVLGLNLTVGYAGQVSLGHAALVGIGGYASALLALKLGVPPLVAIPLAGLVGLVVGLVLGLPTLSLKDHYLAIVSIGFAEIVRVILLNWLHVTGGANGLSAVPAFRIAGLRLVSAHSYYYVVLCYVAVAILVSHRLRWSKIGRAWVAIRENEIAASCSGVNVHLYKTAAFALGSCFAGISGGLYVHLVRFIDPQCVSFGESVRYLCMLYIGGAGSIGGVVIGAIILTWLPEMLRVLKIYYMAIYGIGVILLAVFMPEGISGLAAGLARSLRGVHRPRRANASAGSPP